MTTTTAEKNTTADTVARVLHENPTGITVRDLATAAGVGASTASKALTAMQAAGTATRTPGPTNGNRKTADVWHPATSDTTAPEGTATDADTDIDAADVADTATGTTDDEAAVPADDTDDTATVTEPGTDEAPATDDPATSADEAPAAPRQPDLKVLIMAGVLGDHPDGVTAAVAIHESGLAPAIGDTILAAMEVATAARRLPVTADGDELWVRGDGDLATVDPANAPTHVTCPTCGHVRRVRRPSATGRRSTGTGRVTGDTNSDGSPKLAKNGLRNLVEAFIRDLGPGHDVGPGLVGRELGGRSSGACNNAMEKLEAAGVLVMTNPAPVTFALADNPPAPTPEVFALMSPGVTDDETDETDDDETDADDADDDEAETA